MKTPRPDPDVRWETLLRQARADAGPPTDLTALLRVVRSAELPDRPGWMSDFTALFAPRGALPACLGGACAFALFASWQIWSFWQALPWAQLLAITTGGAP